jgi:hypothetical protein
MGLMKKTHFKLNLMKSEIVRYAHKSERRDCPSFMWNEPGIKKSKYDFIEILGKGVSFSPSLKNSTIFKNKNQLHNSFLKKKQKSKYPIKYKMGEIIDIWELEIWCADDFPKKGKNDKGILEVHYFSEEPWDDEDISKFASYFQSTSKINIEIIVDKKTFEKLNKKIMLEYYSSSEFENIVLNNKKISKKNREYEIKSFNKSYGLNKLEIEFDPDEIGVMRQNDKEESIWGYSFSINNFLFK